MEGFGHTTRIMLLLRVYTAYLFGVLFREFDNVLIHWQLADV